MCALKMPKGTEVCGYLNSTGKVAIENVNAIDERRLKIIRNRFFIAICHPTGNKWQSKTLFLAIFVPRSSIVKSGFDCLLPVVLTLL